MNARWPVPEGWAWREARDFAHIVGGGTPPSKDTANFAEEGVPWITPADLSGYTAAYVSRGARSLSWAGVEASAARELPVGSVLLSTRAPVGYCAIASTPLTTNQGFKSFVIRGGVQPEYLRHYLLHSRNYLESLASGTTFKELSGARVETVQVPIAPLAEQRRIVAKLDDLLARSRRAREALAGVSALLERQRRAVLAAAFRGDLTAEWRAAHPDVEPASRLLERIRAERRARWEAEELAKLEAKGKRPTDDRWKARDEEPEVPQTDAPLPTPDTWTTTSIAHVARITTGGTPPGSADDSYGGETPFVKPTDLDAGREVRTARTTLTDKGLSYLELLPIGAIMVTCIGATIGKVGLAAVPCAINQQINAAVSHDGVLPAILFWWISSGAAQSWIRHNASATTLPILNKGRFSRMPVPLPPLEEQRELVARIESSVSKLDAVAAEVAAQLARLDVIERAVLARAFRGELVPQDPTDEPAAAELARIRKESPTMPSKGPRRPREKTTVPQPAATPQAHSQKVAPASWPEHVRSLGRDGAAVEELYRVSQLSADDFYRELRAHVASGRLREDRRDASVRIVAP